MKALKGFFQTLYRCPLSLQDEPMRFLSSNVTGTSHLVNVILKKPCEEMILHKYLYTLKDVLVRF